MTNPTQPAEGMPERWQLVPVEPTDEMLAAGHDAGEAAGSFICHKPFPLAVWAAMLAAAPKAPPMPDAAIDDLLDKLDTIARDHDVYEYGLPLGFECDPPLREAVRAWLAAQGFTKE